MACRQKVAQRPQHLPAEGDWSFQCWTTVSRAAFSQGETKLQCLKKPAPVGAEWQRCNRLRQALSKRWKSLSLHRCTDLLQKPNEAPGNSCRENVC
jgi:hypothetical protein